MTRLSAFARFWYDFIVGDDGRLAAGVGAGIALTAALASAGLPAWCSMPVVVVATLFTSLWRAAGPRSGHSVGPACAVGSPKIATTNE